MWATLLSLQSPQFFNQNDLLLPTFLYPGLIAFHCMSPTCREYDLHIFEFSKWFYAALFKSLYRLFSTALFPKTKTKRKQQKKWTRSENSLALPLFKCHRSFNYAASQICCCKTQVIWILKQSWGWVNMTWFQMWCTEERFRNFSLLSLPWEHTEGLGQVYSHRALFRKLESEPSTIHW